MVTSEGIHPFGQKDIAFTSTATVVQELNGGLSEGQTLVTSTAAIRLKEEASESDISRINCGRRA